MFFLFYYMNKYKSDDYKLSAVKYYLNNNVLYNTIYLLDFLVYCK